MLKIRLQRVGKRGQAFFRLVVKEHTERPKGAYLELLGSYDPHANKIVAKADRVKHWISNGAQMSSTANNLLVSRGVIEGEKIKLKFKRTKKNEEGEAPKAVKQNAVPAQESKAELEAPKEVEPVN